jgi:D-alanine-D-alanine ligase-like ATP-grasp enzyme
MELMSRLSLAYGAIDLVLTPDGRYIFLEINPNGQWLWIDEMLSLGISHSIAERLSEDTR